MGLQMNVSVNPNTTTTSNYLDNLPQPFYSIPYPINHRDETYWENITRVLTDEEKINTVSYKTDKDEIIICVESLNKFSETLIIGRTLRVLSRYVPLTYNILTIVLAENGIPVTQVSFSRNELEVLIDAPNAELLTERIATIKSAPNKIYDAKVLYNNFNKLDWSEAILWSHIVWS